MSEAEMRKKSPPFGREVERILNTPAELKKYSGCIAQRGSIWVATGPDAWNWKQGKPNHLAVVLPAGEDPAGFNWQFIHGHEPALLVGLDSQDIARRRQIACAMFECGVTAVLGADGVLMQTRNHHSEMSEEEAA